MPDPRSDGLSFRNVAGGMLVQGRDARRITADDLNIVTRRQPTDQEVADMLFAFTVGKHVKSNAIVYAKDGQTAGIGAGQRLVATGGLVDGIAPFLQQAHQDPPLQTAVVDHQNMATRVAPGIGRCIGWIGGHLSLRGSSFAKVGSAQPARRLLKAL